MCFRRERRSRGAIGFDLKGELQESGVSLRVDVRFSIQTRGQAIRSDFYVETEAYSFDLVSEQGSGNVRILRTQDTYQCYTSESFPEDVAKVYPMAGFIKGMFENWKADSRSLLYPTPFDFFPFASEMRKLLAPKVFRINPRTARQSGAPSVQGELGKFGENLPSALDNLASNHPATFQQLEDLMKEVLPALTSLRTRYTASRQMGLFLEEQGFGSPWDAEELSDGTLMSIALFLAILHPLYNWIVIEEPENSLHPWILRKFLEACKEASREKQIWITTQSPLVVAAASPENLFLVERHQGITEIVPALQREPVLTEVLRRQFLDLGRYWLSGGLGAVPAPPVEQEELFPKDEE